MGLRTKIRDKGFGGHHQLKYIRYTGNPNGVITAGKNALSVNPVNGYVYKNTDGATAWVRIEA